MKETLIYSSRLRRCRTCKGNQPSAAHGALQLDAAGPAESRRI